MLDTNTRLNEALFNLENVLLSLVTKATIDNHPELTKSVLITFCMNYMKIGRSPAEA